MLLAYRCALADACAPATAIEASEFPAARRPRGVHGVPAIVVDGPARLGRSVAGRRRARRRRDRRRRSAPARVAQRELLGRSPRDHYTDRVEPSTAPARCSSATHELVASRASRRMRAIFDAHTHLGHDIDGMVGDRDELLAIQARFGIERSFVFCLDEPDRHPGFSAANERTLAHAEAGDGALVPFVRLDLDESPIEEADRCLDAGAQGDQAPSAGPAVPARRHRLEPVFALAAEQARADPDPRRARAAADRGRPRPAARAASATALIIAHAGIVDLAAMARNFAGRAGVFFDTSVWSPSTCSTSTG